MIESKQSGQNLSQRASSDIFFGRTEYLERKKVAVQVLLKCVSRIALPCVLKFFTKKKTYLPTRLRVQVKQKILYIGRKKGRKPKDHKIVATTIEPGPFEPPKSHDRSQKGGYHRWTLTEKGKVPHIRSERSPIKDPTSLLHGMPHSSI